MSVWIVSQKGSWLSVISSFTDCFILAINTSSDLKTLYLTPPELQMNPSGSCIWKGDPGAP